MRTRAQAASIYRHPGPVDGGLGTCQEALSIATRRSMLVHMDERITTREGFRVFPSLSDLFLQILVDKGHLGKGRTFGHG